MTTMEPGTRPTKHWRDVVLTPTEPTVRPCRYCGQPPHIPADACLTLGQKVGRIVGIYLAYSLGLVVLIMVILGLAGML